MNNLNEHKEISYNKRFEIKLVLNQTEFLEFNSWFILNTRFKKAYNSRIVNTIYFDDLKNSSAHDNLSGISFREKYRLRWYGEKLENSAKFELKRKENRLGYKKYFNIPFIKKEISSLKIFELAKIYEKELSLWNSKYFFHLFPKIQVQYKREYYESFNNLRLTIDNNIKYWPAFENYKPFFGMPFLYNYNVVELKFSPESYSDIKNMFRRTKLLPKRHSKYLVGLAILSEVKYI